MAEHPFQLAALATDRVGHPLEARCVARVAVSEQPTHDPAGDLWQAVLSTTGQPDWQSSDVD